MSNVSRLQFVCLALRWSSPKSKHVHAAPRHERVMAVVSASSCFHISLLHLLIESRGCHIHDETSPSRHMLRTLLCPLVFHQCVLRE